MPLLRVAGASAGHQGVGAEVTERVLSRLLQSRPGGLIGEEFIGSKHGLQAKFELVTDGTAKSIFCWCVLHKRGDEIAVFCCGWSTVGGHKVARVHYKGFAGFELVWGTCGADLVDD